MISESAISPSAGPTFFQKKEGQKTSAFQAALQAAPSAKCRANAAPGLL